MGATKHALTRSTSKPHHPSSKPGLKPATTDEPARRDPYKGAATLKNFGPIQINRERALPPKTNPMSPVGPSISLKPAHKN